MHIEPTNACNTIDSSNPIREHQKLNMTPIITTRIYTQTINGTKHIKLLTLHKNCRNSIM